MKRFTIALSPLMLLAAAWLNSIGVTSIALKYHVPRRPDQPKDKPPLGAPQDAQRALSLVRSNHFCDPNWMNCRAQGNH